MTEHEQDKEGTSPPEETHDATTPPGSSDVDEDAVEKAEDELEQAGGGH